MVLFLEFCAALGCGLMAGLFFAFSISVMQALSRLPPQDGIAAMQSINSAIVNPIFMAVFLGTAVACILVVVVSIMRWNEPGAVYLLIGSMIYLMGSLFVTIVCNVPMNESLAAITPTSSNAAQLWAEYLAKWTMWNHIRAISAFIATTLLIIALRIPSTR